MSQNRLELRTDEFRKALRNLPKELADEAQGVVMDAANGAKAEIVAAYPEVTGRLKHGVKVTTEFSAFGASAVVKSSAKHSHLYEYGSQVRHTNIGANRGAMPPRPVFVPVVVRRRKQMYEGLIRLLQRAGFQVSGHAG